MREITVRRLPNGLDRVLTLQISQHVPNADEGPAVLENLRQAPALVLGSAANRFLDEEGASREGRHELLLEVSPRHIAPARKRRRADDCDPK